MTAAVAITRTEHSAADLRDAAKRTDDAEAARRMLAIALVLEGKSRTEAATACGMDRQILCDWVHRYNAAGIAGLHNKTAPGAKPLLSPEQESQVAEWVREGPNLAEHGVTRWRRIDLARAIEERFGVKLAERRVGSLLRKLGFRRLSVRPRCPEQDAASQEAHKKTLPIWSPRQSPSMPATSRSNSGGRMKRGSASKAL
jgi:transposase